MVAMAAVMAMVWAIGEVSEADTHVVVDGAGNGDGEGYAEDGV